MQQDVRKQIALQPEFQKFLDSAPDAIVIVNREGSIVFINEQAAQMFGYQREELLGQPVGLLVPEALREELLKKQIAYFAHPRPMGVMELQGRRKDGSTFPVEISLVPFETGGGLLATSAIRDVTRRKQAEEALRQSEGRFRSDLYYRLNVFPIILPPLRHRVGDVPRLARHFLQKYAQRMGRRIDLITAETMEMLSQYPWPGNVRELEHFIERAVILTHGSTLQVPPLEVRLPRAAPPVSLETLAEAEREHILHVLRETNGIVGGPRGAAARLGLKRTTLASKMRRLGIARGNIQDAEQRH